MTKAMTQLLNTMLILSILFARVALIQCKNLAIHSLEKNLIYPFINLSPIF